MKRRKTATARLKALMEGEPNPFRIVGESYWRNPKNWAEAVVVALNAENLDKPTRLAFKAFKLDPLSPSDWRLLLGGARQHSLRRAEEGKRESQRFGGIAIGVSYWLISTKLPVRNPPAHKKFNVCRFYGKG